MFDLYIMLMVILVSRTKGKRFADKLTAKKIKKERKEQQKKQKKYNSILDKQSDYTAHQQIHKQNNSKSKKSTKFRNTIFNLIIFICIVAIILSTYKIAMWFIDNENNKKLLDNIHDQVSVTEEHITLNDKNIRKLHYDLSKLIAQNSDTVGWINVSNTNIDYPVVQSIDNDYYLNHSFDKTQNSAGWIFADYNSNCSNLGYNTVIYGHNRKDQSMFGSLQTVLKEEWYTNEDNLYVHFSTLNEDHVYRIFSTFVCNDTQVNAYTQTNFSNEQEYQNYLQKLKSCSSHDYEIDVSQTKQIITLYTCYGLNNQRLLVCAALVD